MVEGSGLENRRVERLRGFESHLLRRNTSCSMDRKHRNWRSDREADGARLLSECGSRYRGFESLLLRQVRKSLKNAPIAQLDRAVVYGTTGQRFESSWAYYLSTGEGADPKSKTAYREVCDG